MPLYILYFKTKAHIFFLFRKCPIVGEAINHYTPDNAHYNLTLRGEAI